MSVITSAGAKAAAKPVKSTSGTSEISSGIFRQKKATLEIHSEKKRHKPEIDPTNIFLKNADVKPYMPV